METWKTWFLAMKPILFLAKFVTQHKVLGVLYIHCSHTTLAVYVSLFPYAI